MESQRDQVAFDVKEQIMQTYQADRKQYFVEEAKTKRGGNEGTPHRAFEAFIQTELNYLLAESILDYTRYLIELDSKKKQLEHDAKQRGIAQPKLLKSELDQLQRKMKRMSDNYGRLLLAYKSIGQNEAQFDNCHSSLQFKTKIILNQKLDEQFYEFLIKLYIATLKKAFTSEQDKQKVSEEVARVFRGNCFNKV